MSNKKLILGIAAGVAAMAAVGIVLKRKGYLDGVSEKADELGHDLKDKFNNVKESAKKRFNEVVQKGEDLASKAKEHKANTGKELGDTIDVKASTEEKNYNSATA
ncbi:hypothetical protein GCM10007424_01850 [Flavobacterium suaedae]|uniref:YtxH domain-containing protein n=1 Tax=Flavobacterium suaedae TaxID=1767027 RepID=A0ABQ1JCN1_9FLAO|nr:hypothetical protein [Flavobacterium suaedae]GGB65554.1 hypothetical protein GCM10007424_01850 [Flavobacterium suaedae]